MHRAAILFRHLLPLLLLCLLGIANADTNQPTAGTVSGGVEYTMPDWFKESCVGN